MLYPVKASLFTLSLHDALPISYEKLFQKNPKALPRLPATSRPLPLPRCRQMESRPHALHEMLPRSEEHTSELQSLRHLVCRLLREKKHIDSENATYTEYH